MKKNILLVIFFFALFFSIIIYNLAYKNNDYTLLLGVYNKRFINDKNEYKTFYYDNITYKELINSIKSNDYIIVKNKKIYLTQLIASSSKIIINTNDKKCNRSSKNELINVIRRFSLSKIVFMENNCIK